MPSKYLPPSVSSRSACERPRDRVLRLGERLAGVDLLDLAAHRLVGVLDVLAGVVELLAAVLADRLAQRVVEHRAELDGEEADPAAVAVVRVLAVERAHAEAAVEVAQHRRVGRQPEERLALDAHGDRVGGRDLDEVDGLRVGLGWPARR